MSDGIGPLGAGGGAPPLVDARVGFEVDDEVDEVDEEEEGAAGVDVRVAGADGGS